MTAPALATALEVSVRTIYRDVETLSMAGVPIYTLAGKGGGISLLPEYILGKTLLSDDEQDELLLAIQSLKAADRNVDSLLLKLGAAFRKPRQNWIEVDFSSWGVGRADTTRFALLKKAIIGRQVLHLAYCSTAGDTTTRSICPLKLIYKDKHWYLYAFCRKAQDYRLFKVGRMIEVSPTGEVFLEDYDDETPPTDAVVPHLSTVHLKLHISNRLAYRVYDEFDRLSIVRQADGSFVVEVDFPLDAWVIGYLLSFGTDIKVLEPAGLRQELADYAQKIADHHKT